MQFSKSVLARHVNILKASAAEANTLCLASNQISLQTKMIAIHQNILEKDQGKIKWIDSAYDSADKYQVYIAPQLLYAKNIIFQH